MRADELSFIPMATIAWTFLHHQVQDLTTLAGIHPPRPRSVPWHLGARPQLAPQAASQTVSDELPADQGLEETRFDLHPVTSLSTDSTQARDQPVLRLHQGADRAEPGAQPRTSALSACHPKPQRRNRSERGCSGAKAPEGGCVVRSSFLLFCQTIIPLHSLLPQHTPCCSVSQALGSWVQTYRTRGGSAAH